MLHEATDLLNTYESQQHIVGELGRQTEALREQLRYAEASYAAAVEHHAELRRQVLQALAVGLAAAQPPQVVAVDEATPGTDRTAVVVAEQTAAGVRVVEVREYREGPALPAELPAEELPATEPEPQREYRTEEQPESADTDSTAEAVDSWADEASVGDALPGTPAPAPTRAAPEEPAVTERDVRRLAGIGCDLLRDSSGGCLPFLDLHNLIANDDSAPKSWTRDMRQTAAVRATTWLRESGLVVIEHHADGAWAYSRRAWIVAKMIEAVKKAGELHKAQLFQDLVKDPACRAVKVTLSEAAQALSAATMTKRLSTYGLKVKLGAAETQADVRARELAKQGLSVNAIAKQTGLSWHQANKIKQAA